MTTEIENNLNGKKNKKYSTNNDTQWERILVIENIFIFPAKSPIINLSFIKHVQKIIVDLYPFIVFIISIFQ